MSYVEGFVIACPTDNKQAFIDHARMADQVFIEMGALRVVECGAMRCPRVKPPISGCRSRPRPMKP